MFLGVVLVLGIGGDLSAAHLDGDGGALFASAFNEPWPLDSIEGAVSPGKDGQGYLTTGYLLADWTGFVTHNMRDRGLPQSRSHELQESAALFVPDWGSELLDDFRRLRNRADGNSSWGGRHKQTFALLNSGWPAPSLLPVPEPTTFVLFGVGLIGLSGLLKRSHKDARTEGREENQYW